MPNPTNLQFISHLPAENTNSSIAASQGGLVHYMTAGGTLLIGDAVYHTTTALTVNKSATQTNAKFFIGFVVGGGSWPNSSGTSWANTQDVVDLNPSTTPIGSTAAVVNQEVAIQTNGVAYAVAGAAITIGDQLMFDTGTAGRVITGSTAGQIVGIAMQTATNAGDIIKVFIAHY